MKKLFVALALGVFMLGLLSNNAPNKNYDYPETLSEFGFFQGAIQEMKPVEGVLPYELNTPLFSDYAKKARFIKLPKGAQVAYNDKEVLDFPEGTVIIKTFYYPKDFRKPEKNWQIMETRLLIHQKEGWDAISYIWNEEQTEAYYDLAGDAKEVRWKNEKGKKHKITYHIPNKNQCKGCHNRSSKFMPIGPSARQLNGQLTYPGGEAMNQLKKMEKIGWLTGLPQEEQAIPKAVVWNDPTTGSLEERARIWLDINCGHCHRPDGPANTSGLMLYVHEEDPTAWGINKSPVAAGRGSGGRLYDIVPGKPDQSILVYRIASMDPGVRMPEIARSLVHKEGVELIRDWIREMDAADYKK